MEHPKLVYDEKDRTVLMETDESSVQIYSEVELDEFATLKEIDEFVTEASALLNEMLHYLIHQQELIVRGTYFNRLNDLQTRAAEYYHDCTEFQQEISERNSEVLAAQLDQLYKLEKFLKHYFRALTVSQSLGFSQRLILEYVSTEDYLYLFGFIRNTCSTVEYLGKLMESRMGEATFDLADSSVNCVDVYDELKRQELDDVFNEEEVIRIPPTGQQVRLGDIGLSATSMQYLWKKRCEIVHECPLVVGEEDIKHLPGEVVSTSVITESDAKKLTSLSFRLHYHSVSMFLNFSMSYMKKMIKALVKAIYFER